jgi:hypothetical protein
MMSQSVPQISHRHLGHPGTEYAGYISGCCVKTPITGPLRPNMYGHYQDVTNLLMQLEMQQRSEIQSPPSILTVQYRPVPEVPFQLGQQRVHQITLPNEFSKQESHLRLKIMHI